MTSTLHLLIAGVVSTTGESLISNLRCRDAQIESLTSVAGAQSAVGGGPGQRALRHSPVASRKDPCVLNEVDTAPAF